ncbi:hypothetical protein [Streptomyces sp. NPDC088812]|uniref:hypothetical protein n=1 Tax=Streptomyces sp. NPDC088812 TaxID=3365905 RepID=UPI00382F5093
MPAHTPTLDVDPQDPQAWGITGADARTVEVHVKDAGHDVFVIFKFGLIAGRPLVTLGFNVWSEWGIQGALSNLPITRWEKAARGAAERRLVVDGPYGQGVSPDDLAEILVNERFPELADATGGNALRRRNSLLNLAKMAAEYAEIMESGAKNPAQVLGDRYHVSAATVRSWLHRARREGLALGSAHPNAVP